MLQAENHYNSTETKNKKEGKKEKRVEHLNTIKREEKKRAKSSAVLCTSLFLFFSLSSPLLTFMYMK